MKRALPPLHLVVSFLFLFLLALLLFTNAAPAAEGVRQGLTLCYQTLIPALFPFLVLSDLLMKRQVGSLLESVFSRPVSWLFGISGKCAAPLLLGILCGAPMGAVASKGLYEQSSISKKEARRLQLFINNPGCGFLIGAVGGVMLGNTALGVALFVITWGSALLLAFLLRLFEGNCHQKGEIALRPPLSPATLRDLTDSIAVGFSAMLKILSFVLFFSCISECLLSITSAHGSPPLFSPVLCGLAEITSGISQAITQLPLSIAFRLTAFLASFGGFSICLQVFSVSDSLELRFFRYVAFKLCQGFVALALSSCFWYFWE